MKNLQILKDTNQKVFIKLKNGIQECYISEISDTHCSLVFADNKDLMIRVLLNRVFVESPLIKELR
jgi:hypothetical protein